jgi:hypothetical protein
MDQKKAYYNSAVTRCMLATYTRFFILIIIFSAFLPVNLRAQEHTVYEEIPVFLEVPRLGGAEITALIKGETLYLPVTEMFDFLKIRNIPSTDLESVSGFFIKPEAEYLISRRENLIKYQEKTLNLEPGDLIRTESNLYLRSSYFGKVFGLECIFNFRSLSVTINSKLELPMIREMRQEEMRRNLSRLKGEMKADTTIGPTHPFFRLGMADWSAIATEEINGTAETRLNLTLGSMIAGGEATASLNYNSMDPFSEKQQHYLWRYVNNDFKPLRQVMAGKIATHAISSLYNPVIGIQLTNTPTTYRRSFGTYTLSDRTDPNWLVELYVNNVLVDYVKADASGFFTFKVPLVYGNSIVKLKFFGPWGEERVREQNINIPFNFLPEKTMEYNVSAGFVEDSLFSRFSRASVNYGVTRTLTVGTGLEYLSSVTSGSTMPYLEASMSILNNILLSGEYTFGVRAKGTLSYSLPSNIQLDLNYTKYDKNQKAINFNYLEERKATLSIPLRIKKISTYQRFSLYQIVLPSSNYTTGEWMFSGSFYGVNTNISTNALFIENVRPYIYSNLSLSFKLPANFIIMPQVQYGYTQNSFISARMGLQKLLTHNAFLNVSYEQNFINDFKLAEVGFRYDFSFAQTGVSVRQNDRKTSFIQYARGSLIYDHKTKYLSPDNRTNVGRGGITIIPYLDLNANGTRDHGEPKAPGLNLRANGGRIEKSDRDSTIRILNLESYSSCFIELDANSFENISWRLPVQTLSITVDPDILKTIEIPILVVGEATGKVLLEKDGNKTGQGRIIVSFYSRDLRPAGKTITEDDGYFSYFGLSPGKYSVRIDSAQLSLLKMRSDPDSLQFSVAPGIDGEVIDHLDFTLRLKQLADTSKVTPAAQEKQIVKKDTTYTIVHEMSEVVYTITEDSWAIQIGAFKSRSLAERFKKQLEKNLGKTVEITIAGDYYRVRILDLPTRTEVDENIVKLNNLGFKELWIIRLLARQQQVVLREKQDTIMKLKDIFTGNPSLAEVPEITVQLGAFRQKSNALALMDRLTARFGNKVRIVLENGFYKIRLAGIPLTDKSVLEAMKRLEPELGELGLNDMWLIPPKSPVAEEVVPERKEITLDKAKIRINIPVFTKPDTTLRLQLRETILTRPVAVPTISIRVGQFYKKGDALKAQRKIDSKLKLKAEIIKQWDYYIVVIRGFYTREETYKYYPELAGLGYPGVTLIEDK